MQHGQSAAAGRAARPTRTGCLPAVFLLGLLLASPAPAQPQAPDPATLEAARSLVQDVIGPPFMAQFWLQFRGGYLRNRIGGERAGSPEVARVFDTEVLPLFRAREPDLLAGMAVAYAGVFSLEDIQAMHTFFQSPTGQRVLERETQLNQAIGAMVGTWTRQVTDETLPQVRAAFARIGVPM
jgi:hypothetical protein